jgi:hypothetical protein
VKEERRGEKSFFANFARVHQLRNRELEHGWQPVRRFHARFGERQGAIRGTEVDADDVCRLQG